MAQSVCSALALLWCYNMAYNFSESVDYFQVCVKTLPHHLLAYSRNCNEYQLALIVMAA